MAEEGREQTAGEESEAVESERQIQLRWSENSEENIVSSSLRDGC